jgi:CHAD domain-containing protein
LLDDARGACGRLADPDDGEALHDFRVALRRLRTLLRSFQGALGPAVPKKLQRRLRDLARATSTGRDAEVQLAWIRAHRGELGPRLRAGLRWLVARLEDRRARAYSVLRGEEAEQFRQLERRLRRPLSAALLSAPPGGPAFAAAAARWIRELAAALDRELAAAHRASDGETIHAARVAAKRLRYVIEPLGGDLPQAATVVEPLKRLQDLLGELHDVTVLIGELGEAVAEAAAEKARRLHVLALRGEARSGATKSKRPAPGSAGLLALARLAAGWQERLFNRLVAEWQEGGFAALAQDVAALVERLAVSRVPVLPPLRSLAVARRSRRRRPPAAPAPAAEGGGQ